MPGQRLLQVVVGNEQPNHFRVEIVDNLHVRGRGVDVVVQPVDEIPDRARDLFLVDQARNVTGLQDHLG